MTTDPPPTKTPTTLASQTVSAILESLSAKVPTPGGGAAAAITGATACATAGMVVSYSINKKSLAEHAEFNTNAQDQLRGFQSRFLQLADDDAQGYGVLNALWKLDKDDPHRIAGWTAAVAGAINPPSQMLALSITMLELCKDLISTTNRQLKSDLGVAAVLGQAAARSAAWNVRINIPLLQEQDRTETHNQVDAQLEHADTLCKAIEAGCR
ncbi:MAG: cyclodeaminase/cyclohydrolase family protein [Phycisphaerales bacterium]